MANRADGARVAYPLFQAEDGGSTPTSALQLRICSIGLREARDLNRLWHSVLPDTYLGNLVCSKRSIAYAAEFEGLYFAVAIWTDPVGANRMKNAETTIELRRLAIAPDAPKNTASRVLAVMARLLKKRWPDLTRLVSYQAVDVHEGTIYKAAGWSCGRRTKFKPWKTRKTGEKKQRGNRRAPQTTSDKVRWEKVI